LTETTSEDSETREQAITVGRYMLHRQIARGGMASIHIAHLLGDVGFTRIVAAKRLRPELAENEEFVKMFLDEARVASKVHHRNVVPVLDVVSLNHEVVLVQDYVHGAPLSMLLRESHDASMPVPVPVAASIACQVLAGLHAAHETVDEIGTPLQIVHRDVSPQNIMIAVDGTARLLDFGVAKAVAAAHVTRKGTFKGKLSYAAPEQLRGGATRQSDVYALSVVLWELIVGQRLHRNAKTDDELITEIMTKTPPAVTLALRNERGLSGKYRWQQIEALEPIVRRGLARDLADRWATAAEMEEAITAAVPLASSTDVAQWMKQLVQPFLDSRERVIAAEEARWRSSQRPPSNQDAIPLIGPSHATEPVPAPIEPGKSLKVRTLIAIRARPRTILYTAGALVVAACMAIVLSVRAGDTARPDEPPVVRPVQPLPAAALAPAALAPIAPEPDCVTEPARPAPPPRPAPRPHRVVRPPVRRARPRTDCNPPYYFQGQKKIFKPACL